MTPRCIAVAARRSLPLAIGGALASCAIVAIATRELDAQAVTMPRATGAVRGRVTTRAGEAVARAAVTVTRDDALTGASGDRPLGAMTDDDGRFLVDEIARGSVIVRVRALGYAPAERRAQLAGGDTLEMSFRVEPAPQTLRAVRTEEKSAERTQFDHSPDVGTFTMSGTTLSRVPGIGEPDVLRAIALIAGVAARNDYTAGYNVRGGESDQNLVLLDGIPVYNPFHLGGLFGTFVDAAVGEVELLTGAFPATYGGRLSSVLDVRSTIEGRRGVHATANVSLLSSSATLGGALPDGRTSWNVALRRTYADKVIGALTTRTLPYHFYDTQLGIVHELGGGGRLTLTAYAGRDQLDGNFGDLGDTATRGDAHFGFDWGNRLAGLTWKQPLHGMGDSASFVQRASATQFATNLDLGDGAISFRNTVREARVDGTLTTYFGRHAPRVGYELTRHSVTYDVTSSETGTQFFTLRQHPTAGALFVDDEWLLSKRLLLRGGLRAETVTGTGWSGVSPRLSIKYFAAPNLALTLAGGRYAQWMHALRNEDTPVRIFDFWVASDSYTPVTRATHAVLGAERWMGDSRFVRVEGYLKRYDDLLEPNPTDDPAAHGDEFRTLGGQSYGFDVLVRQLERERLSGWISYGYGISHRTLDGVSFFPGQDRRHNLNVVTMWRPHTKYVWTARFGLATGTPYTNIVGQVYRRAYDGIRNQWGTGIVKTPLEPVGGERNALRYPAFHRLDLSVSREYVRGRTKWAPYLQLINAYNRQNVFTYAFDYASNPPTRKAISQFPFLPSAGVGVEF